MDDIIGGLLLLGMLFGLEIVALFILIMSAIYGRQLIFVILCGVVAAVLMAIESFIWWICVRQVMNLGFGARRRSSLLVRCRL